jgi:outer membrane protein assembly factor BamB
MAGKVFVSHAAEDTARCMPLLRALQAWDLDYWFDNQDHSAGQQLSQQVQMALAECTVFLRVCTRATRQSYWMSLEAGAFIGLQSEDRRAGRLDRQVINLILDPHYTRETFDRTLMTIDAEGGKHPGWVNELRAALGLPLLTDPSPVSADCFPPAPAPAISRRRALSLGLGAAGGLVAVGGAGVLLLNRPKLPSPPGPAPTPTPPLQNPDLLWARAIGTLGVLGGGNGVSAAPLLLNDVLYVGSQDGNFYAIDTHGELKWSKLKQGNPIYRAAVNIGDTVFFLVKDESGGTAIFACDAASGAMRWTRPGPTYSYSWLAAANGHLYLTAYGAFSDFATALDPITGNQGTYFSSTTDQSALPISPPLITPDNVMYIGAGDGYLFALDVSRSGHQLWSADVGATKARQTGNLVFSATLPALANGLVYVGSTDFSVYALDARTGQQRWRYPTGGEVWSAPAVAAGTVYVGSSDNNLYALDAATGKVRWQYTAGNRIRSAPALLGNVIYVGSDDHYVHAVDVTTGAGLRKYPTTGEVIGSPVIANGKLFVSSMDGYLYAYKL